MLELIIKKYLTEALLDEPGFERWVEKELFQGEKSRMRKSLERKDGRLEREVGTRSCDLEWCASLVDFREFEGKRQLDDRIRMMTLTKNIACLRGRKIQIKGSREYCIFPSGLQE